MIVQSSQIPIIVGLGEVLWDVFTDGEKFGGAPANFACHSASFGCHVFMISAVGDDLLGQNAIDALAQKGVDTRYVERLAGSPTGRVNIHVNGTGQPEYEIQENVAWDFLNWHPELGKFAASCDAVCFGTLSQRNTQSRNMINRFLESTRARCLKVFDVNLRQTFYDDSLILNSLRHANALKLNDEELPIVSSAVGIESVEAEFCMQQLAEIFGLKLIILTAGSKGSTLFSRGEFSRVRPTQAIEIRDTVGAGDAFAATSVYGFLLGWPLDKINQLANKVAGFVCTQAGATPNLPDVLLQLIHMARANENNELNAAELNGNSMHPHFDKQRHRERRI